MPGNRLGDIARGSAAATATEAQRAALETFGNLSNDPARVLEENSERAFRQKAQAAIESRWLELGGPASELGLPILTDLHGEAGQDSYTVRFRGGDLVYTGGGTIRHANRRRVRVILSGFGLEQRQESGGDRIFGSVAAVCASSGYLFEQEIPPYVLGPDPDNRVAQMDQLLYEGPPCTLQVSLQLIEQDSGNNSDVRRAIRQRTETTIKAFQDVALAVAGASAAEVAALGLSADSSALSKPRALVSELYGEIIHLALGAGDDPYNLISLNISPDEMIEPSPSEEYYCSFDPRPLRYTEGLNPYTYGRDDGGDRGMIRALLRIETE